MPRSTGWFFLVLALLLAPAAARAEPPATQPDLVSLSGGYLDFDKTEARKRSGDMRAEYRWGMSLLPKISPYFNDWDQNVQFHPFAGVETTTRGALFAGGGYAMDVFIGPYGIFTWSEGAGYAEPGNMARLGSFIAFRSQAEIGGRFDDGTRITFQASHISDAGLTRHNPGAEIIGFYLHVPVSELFGGAK